MGYIYDDWKKLLETYQQCVEKDLEEIHQQKIEVQQMKTDIFNRLDQGKYYYDENRIVISAPEIVIGNVDKSGDLKGAGRVIIKGNSVGLEGVGETGSIVSRAPMIRQTAVDPGIDGQENVVCDISEVVTQAGSVAIVGSDSENVFSQPAGAGARGGVYIHGDNSMQIEAAVSGDGRKKRIEDEVKSLTASAKELKSQMDNQKKSIDKFFSELNKLHEKEDKTNYADQFSLRIHLDEVEELHEQMSAMLPSLYHSTIEFMRCVSQLAEVNRRKKALETEKGTVKTGDDFKKKTTGAQMTINAENIEIATADADGNLHTNDEAGISIRTPRLGMDMADEKGQLVKGGAFGVNAENISLTTINPSSDGKELKMTGQVTIQAKDINMEAVDYQRDDKSVKEKELTADSKITMTAKTIEVATTNPKNVERDDKGKLTKGEYTAEGDVIFRSKTFAVESLDYEVKDGKLATKALTKDGKVSIRAEKNSILAADAEGKATGSISLNAKAVAVKSMDVEKEKLTDDKLAAGSTMTLVSEKMYVGAKSKDVKSKKLQAVSEELGMFADKTFEAQQGDGKATLQLDGGNASLGGSKSQIYGDTTINGKADIKGDVKAPKATIDNLEAKSSFKSSNISDGIAIPGAPSSSKLSAKLKTEDAPKE